MEVQLPLLKLGASSRLDLLFFFSWLRNLTIRDDAE
jgi:hypothetical protein